MNILFICKANMDRSQMAEVIFNKLVKERKLDHVARSAGTDPGKLNGTVIKTDEQVNGAMEEAGFYFGRHRSEEITKDKIKWADVVVLMNNNLKFPDYVTGCKRLILWNVKDPRGRDLNFFRVVRDEIHILVNRLLDDLK